MSYLDLLPSDLTGLLDVYLCHGCKVTLIPFSISEYKGAKWEKIIEVDIPECIMYEYSLEFLTKNWTWIYKHVIAMQSVNVSNFYYERGCIQYHLRGQVCQDVRLLFLDFYYRYARKELV